MTNPTSAPGDIEPPRAGDVLHFMQSPSVGKLAGALAKAQAKFPTVDKSHRASIETKKGPDYGYSYATLPDVVEAVRAHLAAEELAILQPIAMVAIDPTLPPQPVLVTTLVHSSGEWIRSVYPLKNLGDAQAFGSAITYGRRYALCSLLEIVVDDGSDDDGARASGHPEASPPREPPRREPPREPPPRDPPPAREPPPREAPKGEDWVSPPDVAAAEAAASAPPRRPPPPVGPVLTEECKVLIARIAVVTDLIKLAEVDDDARASLNDEEAARVRAECTKRAEQLKARRPPPPRDESLTGREVPGAESSFP